jgi:hypothetical protein
MFATKLRRVVIAGLAGIVLCAGLAAAQEIWVGGGGRFGARFAKHEDFDGSFLYCRGFFGSRYGGQGGWTTDYPGADNNFSIRLSELTRIPVKFGADRQPYHVVVHLDAPELYRCPMLFL